MNTNEYFLKYGDKYKSWTEINNYYGSMIEAGFILFTAESASRLAPPFPGNCGAYHLKDFSGTREYNKKNSKLITEIGDLYLKKHPRHQEMVTTEKPIELKIYGLDDSSFSKFYKTLEEAKKELDLFLGTEPVDLFDLTEDFGFVFTN